MDHAVIIRGKTFGDFGYAGTVVFVKGAVDKDHAKTLARTKVKTGRIKHVIESSDRADVIRLAARICKIDSINSDTQFVEAA